MRPEPTAAGDAPASMSLRRLSVNALAAAANVLFSAVLLFALYRFLVREIGPESIGVWSLVMATAAAGRLGEFGLGGGAVKYVAHDLGAGDGAGAAGTVGMTLVLIAAMAGALCAALYPVATWLLARVLPPGEPLVQGLALLPWALGSLWLTSLANVFASSLDAMQRTPARAFTVVLAGTVQLVGAWLYVPRHGLPALGPLQVVQSLVFLASGSCITLWLLGDARRHLFRFSRPRLKELFRYGGGFQLIALSQLAFEPSVKWLLGAFGTLAQNGFFELANRAVSQLRLVIAAAYQMIVPAVAARIGRDGADAGGTATAYLRAWRLLVLLMVPWYAAVACVLPAAFELWIGRHEPSMVRFGYFTLGGWVVNTFALPAFVIYLAIGKLRWSVTTQLTIGGLNLVLASIGGALAGGSGVVIGAMLALGLGSLVVIVAFHREFGIRARSLADRRVGALVLAGTCAVAAALALRPAASEPDVRYWVSLAAILLAHAVLSGMILWRDPLRRELQARLLPRTSRRAG